MLLIPCPWCGERPEIEFRNAGEAHLVRSTDMSVSDAEWGRFLFERSSPKGVMAERWRHVHGCGRFFNALRHTVSDKILAVYKPGEQRPSIAEPAAPHAGAPRP